MLFGKKQKPEYDPEEFESVQSKLRTDYSEEDLNRLIQLSKDLEVLDFMKKVKKNIRYSSDLESETTLNVNSRGYLTSVSKTKTLVRF